MARAWLMSATCALFDLSCKLPYSISTQTPGALLE